MNNIAKNQNFEMIKFLTDKEIGLNPNYLLHEMYNRTCDDRYDIIDYLIQEKNANINYIVSNKSLNKYGIMTPFNTINIFIGAIKNGDLELIKYLFDKYSDEIDLNINDGEILNSITIHTKLEIITYLAEELITIILILI